MATILTPPIPTHLLSYRNVAVGQCDRAATTWDGATLGLHPVWWVGESGPEGGPDTYLWANLDHSFLLPSDGQSTRCVLDDDAVADAGMATAPDWDANWYQPCPEYELHPMLGQPLTFIPRPAGW